VKAAPMQYEQQVTALIEGTLTEDDLAAQRRSYANAGQKLKAELNR